MFEVIFYWGNRCFKWFVISCDRWYLLLWCRRLIYGTRLIRSIAGCVAFPFFLSYWLVNPHIERWQFFNRQASLRLRDRFSASFPGVARIFDPLWPIERLLAIKFDVELLFDSVKNSLPIQCGVKWFQLIKCLISFLFNLVSPFDALLFIFEMCEKLCQARVEILKSLDELLNILRCRILQVVFYVWVKPVKLSTHLFEKSSQICKFSFLEKLRWLLGSSFLPLINFAKFMLQLIDFRNGRTFNRLQITRTVLLIVAFFVRVLSLSFRSRVNQ